MQLNAVVIVGETQVTTCLPRYRSFPAQMQLTSTGDPKENYDNYIDIISCMHTSQYENLIKINENVHELIKVGPNPNCQYLHHKLVFSLLSVQLHKSWELATIKC